MFQFFSAKLMLHWNSVYMLRNKTKFRLQVMIKKLIIANLDQHSIPCFVNPMMNNKIYKDQGTKGID